MQFLIIPTAPVNFDPFLIEGQDEQEIHEAMPHGDLWDKEGPFDYEVLEVQKVKDFAWTDDYSHHRVMTCKDDPEARFSSKDPNSRTVFPHNAAARDCVCPNSDLLVIVKLSQDPRPSNG